MIRSIINWELWHKLKGKDRRIDTEYLFKKKEWDIQLLKFV